MNQFRISFLLLVCSQHLLLGAEKRSAPATSSDTDFPAALEQITGRAVYLHANWGLAIADLASGKTLYEQNAEKLFAPASTTKLFSTAAALAAFGPDHRFVTPIFRTGTLEPDGTLKGDLILRASGDPSLSGRLDAQGHLAWTNHDHTYAGFETDATLTDTDVLSGLKDLAAQVYQSGIRRAHDVIIDDRLFEKAEGSGSGPSQLVPIVVNDNCIDVLTTPGAAVGRPASITIRPVSEYAQFDAQVMTVSAGEESKVNVEEVSPQHYAVRGNIVLGHLPFLQIADVSNPAAFARALLIEVLKAKGIVIEQSEFAPPDIQALSSDYSKLPIVAAHSSPPFAEQIKVILKVSHNLAASLLPLLLSTQGNDHTLEAGMQREGAMLKQIGVDVGAISFAGGAGGTRADFVTPKAVIGLLTAMSKRSDFATYYDAMPVLGVDGTLVDAVGPDSISRGKVFAKTGTLVWEDTLNDRLLVLSKAMSGYVTSSRGRKLAIGIYLNNVSVKDNKEIEDQGKVLGEIADLIYRSF
jgi:D-alanyl-D-alanine carboxypeptidase/D-alanyl-D-alanine-endopeptidase (penicillin-binding protein 4)